jgi:hypothetical protein
MALKPAGGIRGTKVSRPRSSVNLQISQTRPSSASSTRTSQGRQTRPSSAASSTRNGQQSRPPSASSSVNTQNIKKNRDYGRLLTESLDLGTIGSAHPTEFIDSQLSHPSLEIFKRDSVGKEKDLKPGSSYSSSAFDKVYVCFLHMLIS